MSPVATHAPDPLGTHAAKRSAALSSVFAALGITLLKLLTGLLTGSLGMLSEAAHSGIDLIAAALTLLSVQVSDRPADEDHNYGHGKIESLSAFVETGLMLASSLWIVYESLHRMLSGSHLALVLSPWPFVVLLLSIGVDYSRSRNLHRVAAASQSEALEADAVHFGTDIWSSAAVLFGLAITYAGERFHVPRLQLADPLAALIVSVIILKVGYTLARRTVDNLLDAAPTQPGGRTRSQIRRQLLQDLLAIEGVVSINQLRTRRAGATDFADVTLGIPRNVTFQRSEQITMAATDAVQNLYPGADVVIHSVPTASTAESVHDRIRAVASRANLAIHDVAVQQYDGALHVEQHLEVEETMPLRQAHDLVTRLEAEMRREVPTIATILTHIESEPATIEHPAALESDRQLEQRLREAGRAYPEVLDIHEVFVTHLHDRVQVNCHCTLPDALPMSEVHTIITALEGSFMRENPEVSRLLIHPEPATDNRR